MGGLTPQAIDTKEVLADSKQYAAGKTALTPASVPVDTKETVVYVSREGWPDLGPSTPVAEISQYFSFDGGITWEFGGASEHVGGTWTHRNGQVMPECMLKLSGLPDTKNPGRMIRIEIKPITPLTAKVSFEARSKITIPDPTILDPQPVKERTQTEIDLLADEADPDDSSFDPAYYLEIWQKANEEDRAYMLRLLVDAKVIVPGINGEAGGDLN